MKTAVEIYKLLPKTNCGKCGTPNCFGFAVKLSTGQAKVDQCGTLTEAARSVLEADTAEQRGQTGTVFEQTLAALQPRMRTLDFEKAARLFGARLAGPDELDLMFLNRPYRITREKVVDASGAEPPAWIAILIYNHLSMPDPPPPVEPTVSPKFRPSTTAQNNGPAYSIAG